MKPARQTSVDFGVLEFARTEKTPASAFEEIYVAADTWSENLSSNPLENGETLNISFDVPLTCRGRAWKHG